MGNKKIADLFRETNGKIPVDQGRKKDTLKLLYMESGKRRMPVVYGKAEMMGMQFRYMNKSAIAFQLAGCAMMFLLVYGMYLWGWEKEDVFVSAMILSAALSILLQGGIGHAFTSNVAELSDSCYFNAKQFIAFQMACSGIFNLASLLLVVLFVGYRWKIALLQAGLYIFVPYIGIRCCCAGALLTEFGRRNSYASIAAGAFGCVAFIVTASVPGIFLISSMAFWSVAFVIGTVIYGVQIAVLFREIEKGEILCMN